MLACFTFQNKRRVHALVESAQKAQKQWGKVAISEKQAILTRFNEIVKSRVALLANVLSEETLKPISQAENEINGLYDRVKYFIEQTPSAIKPRVVFDTPARKETITYEPLGVVANVSAWNYPYFVGSNVFVPALLTGNAVIYKPSEFVPKTGEAIANAMKDAGVPDGVFSLLLGPGSVGKQLVTANGIDGVFFTGSVATGKAIAAATLGQGKLIRLQLELGGKDAVYVADDIKSIDDVAAAVLDGVMYNNGQGCCSVERIYVHKKIYKPFLDSITRQAKELVIGSHKDKKSYITSLTRGHPHVTFLREQTIDAEKKGGRVLVGGTKSAANNGCFLPTLIADATRDMLVMKEESFGPIVGIASVENDEDAISKINDSEYGLTASIYTSNNDRAEHVLAAANVGVVYRNACDSVSVRMPWTGRKSSGIGITCSDEGIRSFCNTKSWMLR